MSNPLLGGHCLVSQMVWTIIIILRFCRKNLQKRSQRQVGKAMHSWQKWQITRIKYGECIFLFSNKKRELRNWGWDKLWLPDTIWSDWRRIFMVWSLVIDLIIWSLVIDHGLIPGNRQPIYLLFCEIQTMQFRYELPGWPHFSTVHQ